MRKRSWLLVLSLLDLGLLPITSTRSAPTQPRYAITDLGTLGGAESEAAFITDGGTVVGDAETPLKDPDGNAIPHAFRWGAGQMTDLTPALPFASAALGANNLGDIVGDFSPAPGTYRAFLVQGDRFLDLTPDADDTNAHWGAAINCSGQIVIGHHTSGDPWFSLWWRGRSDEGGGLLGNGHAYAINSRGQIAGDDRGNDGEGDGAVTQSRGRRLVSKRELHPPGQPRTTFAYGINDLGIAAGAYQETAAIWTTAGMRQLPMPGGFDEGWAFAINRRGQVVGAAYNWHTDAERAVLWSDWLLPLDLNALIVTNSGWVLQEAVSINNHGQIVGTGLHNGVQRGFLLTRQ